MNKWIKRFGVGVLVLVVVGVAAVLVGAQFGDRIRIEFRIEI